VRAFRSVRNASDPGITIGTISAFFFYWPMRLLVINAFLDRRHIRRSATIAHVVAALGIGTAASLLVAVLLVTS
jgi:hypothetical protein